MKSQFFLLAAIAAILPASGGTIILETATPGQCCNVGVDYVSWIQSVTYTNVTITANLFSADKGQQTGVAYLMNQVGPGTTAANEIVAPFDIFSTDLFSTQFTLFSGLILGPGNYFLVINPTSPSLQWDFGTDPSVQTLGIGVTTSAQPDQRASNVDPFAPASAFALSSQKIYSVTGDLVGVAPVPEPANIAIVLAGLLLLGLIRFRLRLTRWPPVTRETVLTR